MSEVRVARLEDLSADQPTMVEAKGARIVLVRVGDVVYACDDTCSHQGGPLSEGRLSGTRLTCPWHGWMYDVRTGDCLMPSRGGRVASYPVRVDAGDIWVELPPAVP
jgi:nitrite reductase/ring-hydroxylating ferredoxin subunit